ncbi:hypothetical protein AVEN_149973-1, partial [Araneus ventricosus]
MEVGKGRKEVPTLLFGRGVPRHKDLRYQGSIWGHFPSWSFGTWTSFKVSGPMSNKKDVQRDNIGIRFRDKGDIIDLSDDPEQYEPKGRGTYNQLLVDIATSFTLLVGIFFPSCT